MARFSSRPPANASGAPASGLSLQSLPIEIDDGQIYASLPGADED